MVGKIMGIGEIRAGLLKLAGDLEQAGNSLAFTGAGSKLADDLEPTILMLSTRDGMLGVADTSQTLYTAFRETFPSAPGELIDALARTERRTQYILGSISSDAASGALTLTDGSIPKLLQQGSKDAMNAVKHIDERSAMPAFTTDVTSASKSASSLQTYGRDKEIRDIAAVLAQDEGAVALIVAPKGSRGSDLAAGLARRIDAGKVPPQLEGNHVHMLDAVKLRSGPNVTGPEVDSRIREVFADAANGDRKAIVVVPDYDSFLGHGVEGARAGDVEIGPLIKAALEDYRGKVKIAIVTTQDGATSLRNGSKLDEYVTEIPVGTMDNESVRKTLSDRVPGLVAKHQVPVTDDAVRYAESMSTKYVTDIAQPDGAIRVLDGAASRLVADLDEAPVRIVKLEESMAASKKLVEQLGKFSDPSSKERLAQATSELAEMTKTHEQLTVALAEELALVKSRMRLDHKIQLAGRTPSPDTRALEALQEQSRAVQLQLDDLRAARTATGDALWTESPRLLNDVVDGNAITRYISARIQVPEDLLSLDDATKYLNYEAKVGERVVGMDEIRSTIGNILRTSKGGSRAKDKPIGAVLLHGASGTGKSFIGEVTAEFMFGDATALTKLSGNTLQEKAMMMTLLGSPRGHVGADIGGSLTESVRKRPFQVVQVDEFDKMALEIKQMFLGILQDGYVLDAQQRKIDFRNIFFIFTSNTGQHAILKAGGKMTPELDDILKADLKANVTPEILGRMNATIPVFPHTADEHLQVVERQLENMAQAQRDGAGLELVYGPGVAKNIAERSLDDLLGARPSEKMIGAEIGGEIDTFALKGRFESGDIITVQLSRTGAIEFQSAREAAEAAAGVA